MSAPALRRIGQPEPIGDIRGTSGLCDVVMGGHARPARRVLKPLKHNRPWLTDFGPVRGAESRASRRGRATVPLVCCRPSARRHVGTFSGTPTPRCQSGPLSPAPFRPARRPCRLWSGVAAGARCGRTGRPTADQCDVPAVARVSGQQRLQVQYVRAVDGLQRCDLQGVVFACEHRDQVYSDGVGRSAERVLKTPVRGLRGSSRGWTVSRSFGRGAAR